jgi:NitT/TauT family transport system substrate-binding protein
VTIDAGNGSGGTVTRVASGSYDMGFADLAALMEFHANNPDAPNKPVAVMMVYNNTPAAVLALKKSGITKPADLNGKKLGRTGLRRRPPAFPIFAKANNVSGVQWTAWTRRCARPCWCAATSTPSPAFRSPACSTWKRAA